jgi:hypothetical protein
MKIKILEREPYPIAQWTSEAYVSLWRKIPSHGICCQEKSEEPKMAVEWPLEREGTKVQECPVSGAGRTCGTESPFARLFPCVKIFLFLMRDFKGTGP